MLVNMLSEYVLNIFTHTFATLGNDLKFVI